MQSQISKGWIWSFIILVLIVSACFGFKLFSLQIIKHDDYVSLSDKQQYNLYSKNQNRGSIIFKYKDGREFFAATNKTGYNIEINPKIIKNPEDTYNILSEILELDAGEFMTKASKTNDNSEILAKRIDVEKAEKIIALDLQGVVVSKEKWRFYPGKNLAAQVVGFQSYKGDELKGRYGLERFYNDVLTEDDSSLYKNFFVEIFSGVKKTVGGENLDGSAVSTVEPNVQTYCEEIIEQVQKKYNSDHTGVIIMDPQTGAIIAMAEAPTFDVNTFGDKNNEISVFNNDSVESVYEMGSIIKPLTMAIGLDTKVVTPNTTYNDKGTITIDGKTISNFDKKARGVVGMQEVLSQSLNTGVTFVVQKVGNEVFTNYMKKLIGEKTGIDLPNEVPPLIGNLDSPRVLEHANASFGQGIAISPIQTIRALATLGNGGLLVRPHVVSSIKYNMGVEKDIAPKDKVQVYSKETSEAITRMLVTVVDKALLGGTVSIPNYSIAAKTGTAQIPDNVGGGYYADKYLHSFFGYFPAYDPQFIILLYTAEPKGVQYASHTLTLPFIDLTKYLINYYQIEPDR